MYDMTLPIESAQKTLSWSQPGTRSLRDGGCGYGGACSENKKTQRNDTKRNCTIHMCIYTRIVHAEA